MKDIGITRQKAIELIDLYIGNPITRLHLLETEAIMRSLAAKFGESEDEWGIIGLLHDIDWDLTKDNPSQHCIRCQKILKESGASDFLIESVRSHGYENKMIPELIHDKRNTDFQHCLMAAETLTGLIIASVLVQPDKKLASLSFESLKKKYKNKKFAEKCDRNLIDECEKAGISLDDFMQIGLRSLQNIAKDLGF